MKLHLQAPSSHLVTGVGPGWVRVGQREYRENCVLTPQAVHTDFVPGGFDALEQNDFASLLSYAPEIVLLGTGASQRFPHPRLTQDLAVARVGLEIMDTRAACRTFNILLAEGRSVVAALFLS